MTLPTTIFIVDPMSGTTLAIGAVGAAVLLAPTVVAPLLAGAWSLRWLIGTIAHPGRRAAMIASGVLVAGLVAGDLAFGHDIMLFGFPGFLAGYAILLPLGVDATARSVQIGFVIVYWLVNTALFGLLLPGIQSPHADRRERPATTAAALLCALLVGTTSCLSATPPKTPNQRAAERVAPSVVAPPPPDAGRTPRPASSDPG